MMCSNYSAVSVVAIKPSTGYTWGRAGKVNCVKLFPLHWGRPQWWLPGSGCCAWGERDGRRVDSNVYWYLGRQVGHCSCWKLIFTCSQHQTTAATEPALTAVRWPSCWTLISFVPTERLPACCVHLYKMHPTLGGNYIQIVRTVFIFL